MISKWAQCFLAALIPALTPDVAGAERYNLQAPQSIIAHEIYDLHTLIFLICCVIFVAVFAVMTYSIIKHRKSVGHKAEQFHENTAVEIIWTIVPFIILIGMAIPATKTILSMKDTSSPDITIKATGYQWKWGYDYLHEGVSFYSALATPRDLVTDKSPEGAKKRAERPNYLLEVDNPVVVPVGKKVRIITTANDVIHAWSVPAFGVKQDAIPGFVRDTWFRADKIGVYRGQCSELCGKEHGFMPIVVEVVAQEKYDQWIAEQKKKTASSAMAAGTMDGTAVYEKYCTACHGAGVAGAPKFGDRVAWGPRLKQGQEVLYTHAIKGHNAMPPKGGAADMSDDQIKAAVDYLSAAGK